MAGSSSHGTLIKMGDGGSPSEVFTTIGEVKDISGPGLSANTVDTTSHSSNGYTEAIATLLTMGETTFDINWDPDDPTHDGSTGLLAALQSRELVNFQVVYPLAGNPTDEFAAFVTNLSRTAPVDGVLGCSVTLTGSGAPTALA